MSSKVMIYSTLRMYFQVIHLLWFIANRWQHKGWITCRWVAAPYVIMQGRGVQLSHQSATETSKCVTRQDLLSLFNLRWIKQRIGSEKPITTCAIMKTWLSQAGTYPGNHQGVISTPKHTWFLGKWHPVVFCKIFCICLSPRKYFKTFTPRRQ